MKNINNPEEKVNAIMSSMNKRENQFNARQVDK